MSEPGGGLIVCGHGNNSGHKRVSEHYNVEFYEKIGGGSLQSAYRVVPFLTEWFAPQSVVDFGCGTGAWLKVFLEHGAKDVQGYDFGELATDQAQIDADCLNSLDLSAAADLGRRFDLAISLEVAEHLPAEAAAQFVANLVKHADAVAFSAAIPGQTGRDHLNCQYPSFWKELFAAHGYSCFDVLRPRIWDMPEVEFWYRQNTLIFVRSAVLDRFPHLPDVSDAPLDVVHPVMLAHELRQLRGQIERIKGRQKDRIQEAKDRVRKDERARWQKKAKLNEQ